MMCRFAFFAWLVLAGFVAAPAHAQQNCPRTPAVGNSSTTCANTAFVTDSIADSTVNSIGGATGAVTLGNGLSIAGQVLAVDPSFLRGYLGGLNLSNDATTPNSVLDISAGVASDSTNAALMKLGAFTKSTAGAWAAGSGSNGMGNGLTIANSTWYHVILANNGGTPDIYFDTSPTGANRPSGISDTKVRRIGSFLTNASKNIVTFAQNGDEFLWKTPVQNENAFNLTTAAHTTTLTVPTGIEVWGKIVALYNNTGTNGAAIVYPIDMGTQVANSPTGYLNLQNPSISTFGTADLTIRTNTSGQIQSVSNAAANNQFYIVTYGWVDTRGRFN